jgi:hypothetical protein
VPQVLAAESGSRKRRSAWAKPAIVLEASRQRAHIEPRERDLNRITVAGC